LSANDSKNETNKADGTAKETSNKEKKPMKDGLLKQGAINLAMVAVASLLGACATTTSSQAENKGLPTRQRSSASPLVTKGYAGNGDPVTVKQTWGWSPFED
jgi:hypothetical protein